MNCLCWNDDTLSMYITICHRVLFTVVNGAFMDVVDVTFVTVTNGWKCKTLNRAIFVGVYYVSTMMMMMMNMRLKHPDYGCSTIFVRLSVNNRHKRRHWVHSVGSCVIDSNQSQPIDNNAENIQTFFCGGDDVDIFL